KYGAKMIAESRLEAVPNDTPDRDYEIDFTIPEFTCLAPDSGFPDFATIRIRYIPDQKLVELKSLKFYINKFRDQEIFHEGAVNQFRDDLFALLDRGFRGVVGDFNARANNKPVVPARHTQKGYSSN